MGQTRQDSLYFSFDNISCRNYGLMQVNLNNGLFEEQLHASRSIVETKIRNNDTPQFHGLEESPFEYDMTIAFEDKFTDSDVEDIVLWLFQDNYKELIFEGKPNRVYMVMFIGDPNIVHNGLSEGYITLKVRCNSSKVLSPLITTDTFTINGTKTIFIDNSGHVEICPEISIENASGLITITNLTGGREEIFDLYDLETVYHIFVNCEKEYIDSNDGISPVYLYDNLVGDYPKLYKGINTIKIDGQCEIQFRYRLKYKF